MIPLNFGCHRRQNIYSKDGPKGNKRKTYSIAEELPHTLNTTHNPQPNRKIKYPKHNIEKGRTTLGKMKS